MKITNVRLRKLEGVMDTPPKARIERLRRPTDIYPHWKEKRIDGFFTIERTEGKEYKFNRIFVQIDTDEGVSGIAGPVSSIGPNAPAFFIDTAIKQLLIGQDPIANEYLWDIMFRSYPNNRKGDYMRAVSMVDIALWDLKGKWVDKPVMRLLGGPVQEKIPAYISTLGWSLEPKTAAETTKRLINEGYTGMKRFLTEGPQDGISGERKNYDLIASLREAAGPEMKIMIDAWKSWDVPYTVRMTKKLLEFDPYWIEEPVLPDYLEKYAEIRA
ncbi:MAG: enolase C-terminal domain-like protein, partial [Candidatus Hodarchaeales archaeon]